MKRFLRYVLYRELYRKLRNLGTDSKSDKTQNQRSPSGSQSSPQEPQQLPIEEGPIETAEQLKQVLQEMDPYEFEHFVADLWEYMGWQTDVSSAAQDRGVDVIATKEMPYEQTTLIQAKRYGSNTTVGSPEIQQYASLEDQYNGVDKVAVVTTNEFTGQARELADRLNVKLIDGDDLVELIEHHQAGELVAEYLDFVHRREKQTDNNRSEETTGSAQSQSEQVDSQQTRHESQDTLIWQGVIGAATVGWIVSVALINTLPETLGGLLILGSWVLLPVGIYKDSQLTRRKTDWPQYRWVYIVLSLIWIIAIIPGVVYLWKRRTVLSR